MEAAIKGMLDGTLNPDDVKIEGIETEEEKRKKEVLVFFFFLCQTKLLLSG